MYVPACRQTLYPRILNYNENKNNELLIKNVQSNNNWVLHSAKEYNTKSKEADNISTTRTDRPYSPGEVEKIPKGKSIPC